MKCIYVSNIPGNGTLFPENHGFDLDVEDGVGYQDMTGIIVQVITDIAAMKNAAGEPLMVTLSPTSEQWTPYVIPVLQALYKNLGRQPVSWLNVQSYASISDWLMQQWMSQLSTPGTGVEDPASFIGFGLGVLFGGYLPPSQMQAQFAALTTKPGGGGIWNSSEIENNVYNKGNVNNNGGQTESTSFRSYAQAILQGLATPNKGGTDEGVKG